MIHLTVAGTAPWVIRVAEIKASTAINVEAERKVAQLNDEMQGLVRRLKTKDQNIQESAVKIELMERRMETVKKQADTIDDLAAELSKARKQERAYEEAMEQLQTDLESVEQENAKLKTLSAGLERQGMSHCHCFLTMCNHFYVHRIGCTCGNRGTNRGRLGNISSA